MQCQSELPLCWSWRGMVDGWVWFLSKQPACLGNSHGSNFAAGHQPPE